jgi:hypothetical protein
VWEFRLRHLARLESLANPWLGGPACVLTAPPPGDDRIPYRRRLAAARDAAERSRLDWGSDAVNDFVFGTATGRTAFLRIALRAHKGLGRAEVAELAMTLTEEEWAAVDGIALAVDQVRVIDTMIYREVGLDPPSSPDGGLAWTEIVARLAKALQRRPVEIMDMFLSEVELFQRDGKRAEAEYTFPEGTPIAEASRVAGPIREFWASANGDGGH